MEPVKGGHMRITNGLYCNVTWWYTKMKLSHWLLRGATKWLLLWNNNETNSRNQFWFVVLSCDTCTICDVTSTGCALEIVLIFYTWCLYHFFNIENECYCLNICSLCLWRNFWTSVQHRFFESAIFLPHLFFFISIQLYA